MSNICAGKHDRPLIMGVNTNPFCVDAQYLGAPGGGGVPLLGGGHFLWATQGTPKAHSLCPHYRHRGDGRVTGAAPLVQTPGRPSLSLPVNTHTQIPQGTHRLTAVKN